MKSNSFQIKQIKSTFQSNFFISFQISPSPKILQTTMNPQQTNQNFTYITNFSLKIYLHKNPNIITNPNPKITMPSITTTLMNISN